MALSYGQPIKMNDYSKINDLPEVIIIMITEYLSSDVEAIQLLDISGYHNTKKYRYKDYVNSSYINDIKDPYIVEKFVVKSAGCFKSIPKTVKIIHFQNDYGLYNDIKYPDKLEKVIIWSYNNTSLKSFNFPDTIEELEIYHMFNNDLNTLPKKLKKLHIDSLFNKNINKLPESLEELNLIGTKFDQPIECLPKSLKKLCLGYRFNHDLNTNNLPSSLEYLQVYGLFDKDLNDLPKNTKTLCIHSKMNINLSKISKYVETLIINDSTISESLIICDLPENIKRLILNSHYIEIINLPNSLEYLELSYLSIMDKYDILNNMTNKLNLYVRNIPQNRYNDFKSKLSDKIELLNRKY